MTTMTKQPLNSTETVNELINGNLGKAPIFGMTKKGIPFVSVMFIGHNTVGEGAQDIKDFIISLSFFGSELVDQAKLLSLDVGDFIGVYIKTMKVGEFVDKAGSKRVSYSATPSNFTYLSDGKKKRAQAEIEKNNNNNNNNNNNKSIPAKPEANHADSSVSRDNDRAKGGEQVNPSSFVSRFAA